jgi:hypothetical protein
MSAVARPDTTDTLGRKGVGSGLGANGYHSFQRRPVDCVDSGRGSDDRDGNQ